MERLEFCEMVPSLLNRLSNTTSHGNVEKSLDFYFLFFFWEENLPLVKKILYSLLNKVYSILNFMSREIEMFLKMEGGGKQ
jgi:hypothetical protein